MLCCVCVLFFFFFKQKTAYEMRISDWSSDVCSSDLVSLEYAPKFAAAGAVVIDNSSAFRYDDDVPLVVAEVNPEAMANRPRGIIANPNCSTMQLLVALSPIHHAVGIERLNVPTSQSVSDDGRSPLEDLDRRSGV